MSKCRQALQVLVKWKNYEEPTWEKFVGLAQDAPHAIQKYWINYEKKVDFIRQQTLKLLSQKSEKAEKTSDFYDKDKLESVGF